MHRNLSQTLAKHDYSPKYLHAQVGHEDTLGQALQDWGRVRKGAAIIITAPVEKHPRHISGV